jgi:sugar phosphate isomerase/epimerase
MNRTIGAAAASVISTVPHSLLAQGRVIRNGGVKVKLGLNAYSFNTPLSSSEMTLEDVVDYCARYGFDGLDATGYYFSGYPKTPADEYVYNLKKKAFLNGLTIFGTGVRNNFAVPDAESRRGDVRMVKDWIEVAQKLGATVIRIFSGPRVPEGYSFDGVLKWMVPDIQECVEYGKKHGVIVGLQNHDDFVKTADQTIRIVNAVNSEWFGVVLDVGSLRQSDPYEEIEKLLPYAVSWQLKEMVWNGEREVPIDLARIKSLIERSGYRGFLPLETLGRGDPRIKVAAFLEKVRNVFAS